MAGDWPVTNGVNEMTKQTNKPTATSATDAPAMAFVVSNGEQVDISDLSTITLADVIAEVVSVTKRAHGAQIRLAAKLNGLMEFDWFDVEHGDNTNESAMLKPHKEAVMKGYKDAGHSNASQVWKRLRDYARNLRAGLAPNGKTMANGDALPKGEGEGEGGNANPARRSDGLFMIDELTRCYKRAMKSDDERVKQTAAHISAALKCMGFDTRTLKD